MTYIRRVSPVRSISATSDAASSSSVDKCACTKSQGPGARLVPTSLTLPALATAEAPDAVLSVAEVHRAIRQGAVTATTETKAAAEETAPEPPERPQKKRARE